MRKKEEKNENRSLTNRMAEVSGIPRDVVLGVPVLSITGRQEINLANYRGILEYTDTLIRVQTKVGQIKLKGKRLQIEYYTNDEMKVVGVISEIEYQN